MKIKTRKKILIGFYIIFFVSLIVGTFLKDTSFLVMSVLSLIYIKTLEAKLIVEDFERYLFFILLEIQSLEED